MRLTKSRFEIIKDVEGLKKVEVCGRVCYKSEDRITSDSYKKFVKMLVDKSHLSVLEHAVVKFLVKGTESDYIEAKEQYRHFFILEHISCAEGIYVFTIQANLRAWYEHFKNVAGCSDLNFSIYTFLYKIYPEVFKYLYTPTQLACDNSTNLPTIYPKKSNAVTVKFTISRGISHEFVRHRLFSFSQESTRYCNYANKGIQFILPAYFACLGTKFVNVITDCEITDVEEIKSYASLLDNSFTGIFSDFISWVEGLLYAEKLYNKLLSHGMRPELARGVLPHDLKTELIMTGTEDMWNHFLSLRDSEKAHPDAREVVQGLKGNINKFLFR